MDQHEIELIHRAQAGDTSAFDDLIRLYGEHVLHIACGILGNRQDAYDAYQNTFIRAYSNIRTFRFQSAFSTWLVRITINQAINLKKKLRWKQRLSFETVQSNMPKQGLSYDSDNAGFPENAVINEEFSQQINHSLDQLSDRERAVFVLKHIHGYKIREIAIMIGCAEGSVKSYLFRAVKKMRSALLPYYESVVVSS